MKKADLHIHTCASDGSLTALEVVNAALKAKLSYISITDHDTMEGYLALQQNKSLPIQVIPGIEFSTDTPKHEVHILGYYLHADHPELIAVLHHLQDDRTQRIKKTLMKLSKLGFPIDYELVLHYAKNAKSMGRPHVAKALVKKGHFPNVKAAFDSVLRKNGPAYVSHFKLSPQDTISLILKAGGIPVLAHPGLINNDQLVYELVKLGIKGIEVYYPQHNFNEVEKYLALAKYNHLIITGGSDFHGPGRYPESIGKFSINAELIETFIKYT